MSNGARPAGGARSGYVDGDRLPDRAAHDLRSCRCCNLADRRIDAYLEERHPGALQTPRELSPRRLLPESLERKETISIVIFNLFAKNTVLEERT